MLRTEFPQGRWYNNHGSLFSGKGRPDIEGVCESWFFAFELKAPGKYEHPHDGLTELQTTELIALQKAGAYVGCFDSVGAVRDVVMMGIEHR